MPLAAGLGLVSGLAPSAGPGQEIGRAFRQPFEIAPLAHDHARPAAIDRIVGPQPEFAAGFQLGGDHVDGAMVDHPPLGMPRLGPGIGMEQVDETERCVGHPLKHVERIAPVQPDIAEMPVANMRQRRCHAVDKGFATDEPMIGEQVGAIGKMLARSESDLEVQRALLPEQPDGIDRTRGRHRDPRVERVEQRRLRRTKRVVLAAAI